MNITPLRFLLFVCAAGCAHAPAPTDLGPRDERVLSEERALRVIQETLREQGAKAELAFPVRVEDGIELLADLRIAKPGFAIEWVSEEDRRTHEQVLPPAPPNGPLRIITGRAPDASLAQVLVLDANAYRYEGNPLLVQRGAPSLSEAEDRVRRDVLDFVEYTRGQGGL